jgi:hypothetical protein
MAHWNRFSIRPGRYRTSNLPEKHINRRSEIGGPADYYDKVPFKFNGTIAQVHVEYRTIEKARVGDMTTKE